MTWEYSGKRLLKQDMEVKSIHLYVPPDVREIEVVQGLSQARFVTLRAMQVRL